MCPVKRKMTSKQRTPDPHRNLEVDDGCLEYTLYVTRWLETTRYTNSRMLTRIHSDGHLYELGLHPYTVGIANVTSEFGSLDLLVIPSANIVIELRNRRDPLFAPLHLFLSLLISIPLFLFLKRLIEVKKCI